MSRTHVEDTALTSVLKELACLREEQHRHQLWMQERLGQVEHLVMQQLDTPQHAVRGVPQLQEYHHAQEASDAGAHHCVSLARCSDTLEYPSCAHRRVEHSFPRTPHSLSRTSLERSLRWSYEEGQPAHHARPMRDLAMTFPGGPHSAPQPISHLPVLPRATTEPLGVLESACAPDHQQIPAVRSGRKTSSLLMDDFPPLLTANKSPLGEGDVVLDKGIVRDLSLEDSLELVGTAPSAKGSLVAQVVLEPHPARGKGPLGCFRCLLALLGLLWFPSGHLL